MGAAAAGGGLLEQDVLAAGLAWLGIAHRRRHRPGDTGRILDMGGSYVVMLTAFYVDNGKSLPLWQDLPATLTYWLLPSAVGACSPTTNVSAAPWIGQT